MWQTSTNCTERPSELLVTLLKLQQHRVACFLSQSQWSWHLSTKFSLTVSVKGCLSEVDTFPLNFPLQFQWRAVSVKLTPFHQTFPYSFSEGLSRRAVSDKLTPFHQTFPYSFSEGLSRRAVSDKLTPFHQTFPYSFSEGLSWRAVPVKLTLSNFPFQFQIRANGLLIQCSQRNGHLAVKISL